MTTTVTHRGRLGRLGLIGSGALMAVSALAVGPMPAAAHEVERETRGSCTRTSDWELDLEKEHGRIEVKVDVDTRVVGRQWRVRIWHNGTLTSDVLRRTDRDGEFEVERTRRDQRGRDAFRFRAVDQVSGEVCTGSLSI